MRKVRAFAAGFAVVAGLGLIGAGVANAQDTGTTPPAENNTAEPSTGSADTLADLLSALTSGSGGTETGGTDTTPGTGTES